MNPGPVDEFGNATRFVVGVCARRYKGDERSQVRSRLMERAPSGGNRLGLKRRRVGEREDLRLSRLTIGARRHRRNLPPFRFNLKGYNARGGRPAQRSRGVEISCATDAAGGAGKGEFDQRAREAAGAPAGAT